MLQRLHQRHMILLLILNAAKTPPKAHAHSHMLLERVARLAVHCINAIDTYVVLEDVDLVEFI